MPKFRKKPVVIQAVQYDGNYRCLDEFPFSEVCNIEISHEEAGEGKFKQCLIISTLEGKMKASIGDYIIRGVNGEYYPCKLDIFEKTYEAVIGNAAIQSSTNTNEVIDDQDMDISKFIESGHEIGIVHKDDINGISSEYMGRRSFIAPKTYEDGTQNYIITNMNECINAEDGVRERRYTFTELSHEALVAMLDAMIRTVSSQEFAATMVLQAEMNIKLHEQYKKDLEERGVKIDE